MKPEDQRQAACRQEYALQKDSLLRLKNAKGATIRCMTGLVLITAFDIPEDIELHAGEAFMVPNRGLALLEAIGHGVVRIEYGRQVSCHLHHHLPVLPPTAIPLPAIPLPVISLPVIPPTAIPLPVIPAQAGIHTESADVTGLWVPACAGTTGKVSQ